MKETIQWSDNLSIGVEEIDEQHKKLISIFNELNVAISENKDKGLHQRIINELIRYTFEHFDAEEKILFENNYEESEAHKKEHEAFKISVYDFVKKYSSGQIESKELFDFLLDWLKNHIFISDKKYGHFRKKT